MGSEVEVSVVVEVKEYWLLNSAGGDGGGVSIKSSTVVLRLGLTSIGESGIMMGDGLRVEVLKFECLKLGFLVFFFKLVFLLQDL